MDGLEDLSLTLHRTLFPNPILGGSSDYFRPPEVESVVAYLGRLKDFLRPKTTEDENRQVHNLLDTVRFDRQNTQQVSFRNTRSNARLHVIRSFRVQSAKTECEAEQARR